MREGATEFHMVGGLHPDLPFEYFLDLMRGLKKRCPTVHLKAFTMVEVGYFSRISKLSIRDTLLALKEAGVDSLPGGGAEIFNPRVRKIICDHKVSGQQWLNIARTAHEIGLRSNATMLYGHVETEEERVEHLLRCASLQDETHGFVGLHSAGVSSGKYRPRASAPAHGLSRSEDPSPFRACCSTTSTTSRPTG